MKRQTVTVSSQTSSAAIPVDPKQNPFSIGIGCVVPSGTLTYKVQHTFDDPYSGVTPVWFDHSSITGKTASADGNYASPVAAIRLTVTAYTSGSVTMTILQGSSQ